MTETPTEKLTVRERALLQAIAEHTAPLQARIEQLEECVRRLLQAERERHE